MGTSDPCNLPVPGRMFGRAFKHPVRHYLRDLLVDTYRSELRRKQVFLATVKKIAYSTPENTPSNSITLESLSAIMNTKG